MSAAFFTLIACLLTGLGARDQLLVAGLAARNGQHWALLVAAAVSAVATAALAAIASFAIAPVLADNPAGRQLFAGIALALAGLEMLLLKPKPLGSEPTQSLGATAIVLFAHQLTDALRFTVFALAVATGAPIAAGLGGAAGAAAVVAVGWLAPDELAHRNLRAMRIGAGVVILLVAGYLALGVFNR
jgi:hypothetical protein